MNKYQIVLNSKRCIGCHGCTVHCKTNKNLPLGPILCEISHTPTVYIKGVPRVEFSFRNCHQCSEPYCAIVCPVEALHKREDGIVILDQEKCIGCMACAGACPWHIPQFNPETDKMIKCDLCVDRIDQGLKPACVSRCTTHALKLVTLVEA